MVKNGPEGDIIVKESPKLIQPREHKAKVTIWADLTLNDLDLLEEAITPDQIKNELAMIFGLTDYQENKKSLILLDLYFYLIQFSRDHHFSKEQTSAFFSIVKRTHEICVETPFGNVDQCFNYFKEMVLCHAVKRPPYSIDLFSPEEVKQITDYVLNTYFRHFKLYKYVFTPMVRLDLSIKYSGIPETPPPEPSEEVDGEQGAEDQETEQEAPEGEKRVPDEAEGTDQKDQDEESPAAKELRALIRKQLEEEVVQLKISVDQQIKESEDVLNKKLQAAEGAGGAKPTRSTSKTKRK